MGRIIKAIFQGNVVYASLLGHYAQTQDLSFTFIVSVKDVADLASFCGSHDCTVLSCVFMRF